MIKELRDKLRADLDWRGPNEKHMAHVVISRKQARAVTVLLDVAPAAVIQFVEMAANEVERDEVASS